MMLTIAGLTHPGRVRTSNEDTLHWDATLGLLLVADGMGGHNAGEVAAHLAADAIRSFLEPSTSPSDITWPYGVDPALSYDGNRLVTALKLANHRVLRAADQRPAWSGMGTTVVAALVKRDVLTCVSVGDSRLYRWNRRGLEQVTVDDSWVASLLARDPGASATALAAHPMRHVLTRVVGGSEQLDAPVRELRLAVGDRLLLSSDGLHGLVDDAVVARLIGTGPAPDAVAQALVDAALERGGTDNVTALVAFVDATD